VLNPEKQPSGMLERRPESGAANTTQLTCASFCAIKLNTLHHKTFKFATLKNAILIFVSVYFIES